VLYNVVVNVDTVAVAAVGFVPPMALVDNYYVAVHCIVIIFCPLSVLIRDWKYTTEVDVPGSTEIVHI